MLKKIFSPFNLKAAKYLLVFLCLCGCMFSSCSKKEEKIPADIISKEKMVQVMMDIHLAEAQSQLKSGYDDSKSIKQSYYKFIFNKHKINYNQLIRSFDFYAAHPDLFSKIYDDVITELSKKQAKVNSSDDLKSSDE